MMSHWWIHGAYWIRDGLWIVAVIIGGITGLLMKTDPPYLRHRRWRIIGQVLALILWSGLLPWLVRAVVF